MGQLVTFETPNRYYDFTERLKWSEGFLQNDIEHILKARIPACVGVERAQNMDDRNGTDYWALRVGLPSLSIDVKVRDTDYALRGKDDLALETWSKIDDKLGWTRDTTKRTDFIMWHWRDTKRFLLVSFPILCMVFTHYWQIWQTTYQTATQTSGAWQSECVFVPRAVVMDKVLAWSSGTIGNQQ